MIVLMYGLPGGLFIYLALVACSTLHEYMTRVMSKIPEQVDMPLGYPPEWDDE